ncbi:hypothetical protein CLV48_104205 [Cecembia rubra]|jgi:hypothetical protein|uniref:Uncharacterized protein n=1 Tax=Cecembia rubra TaxID=1485585 RepID=A0A2P8E6D3_9BACT|nr:hypothetical protein CLV48_104205 [Cecembia rubra]
MEDEQLEDNIVISGPILNSKFSKTGFSISATVVEEEDRRDVSRHYQLLKT